MPHGKAIRLECVAHVGPTGVKSTIVTNKPPRYRASAEECGHLLCEAALRGKLQTYEPRIDALLAGNSEVEYAALEREVCHLDTVLEVFNELARSPTTTELARGMDRVLLPPCSESWPLTEPLADSEPWSEA